MSTNQLFIDVFDIVVIGAGVVGCAMARRFVLDGAKVLVLEKAADVLDGASKANSAILHTGFDASPGSLEQACIANGYQEYLDIRGDLGLPLLQSSALVLAWTYQQLEELDGLIAKAHENGVHDVARLSQKEISALEPNLSVSVKGGFRVPGESLIDPWSTAHAYILQALANGAELLRGAEVLSGKFDGNEWTILSSRGAVKTKQVITCAGLYGDVVDERLLGKKFYSIKPRRGQFLVFDKAAAALTSSIILPVPGETTKGIVVCRTIFGNLLVGPTAEEQESRTDTGTDAGTLLELRASGTDILPGLADYDVTATFAGLRPATEEQDYRITHDREHQYFSVGGIRSTGLSAALGIANHVAFLNAGAAVSGKLIVKPVLPKPTHLSDYHSRDWQNADNGGIVCHCERVTRREIEAALSGTMPPATLQGLKRRTRVCMGRCQGFYCTGELSTITNGRLDPPIGLSNDS